MMKRKMIWMPFLFLLMGAAMTAIVMLLWNWLMPLLFGLSLITFWQAMGILILSKILFGGFCGKRGYRSHCSCHHGQYGWKHKFKAKWQNMSEEDRQKWESKFAGTRCQSSDNISGE